MSFVRIILILFKIDAKGEEMKKFGFIAIVLIAILSVSLVACSPDNSERNNLCNHSFWSNGICDFCGYVCVHQYKASGECEFCDLNSGLVFALNEDGAGYTLVEVSDMLDVVIPGVVEGKPVTTIGKKAFLLCRKIASVTIPNSVTLIDEVAFAYCMTLKTVIFEEGSRLVAIGEGAFMSAGIETIVIPNGVVTIGSNAFALCVALKDITIPNSVKTIGNNVFLRNQSLQNVYYSGAEADWNKISIGSDNSEIANATIHFKH